MLFVPTTRTPLYVADIDGGEARAVTELDADAGEISHRHPQFLPDGEHFIFVNVTDAETTTVHLGSLRQGKLQKLVDSTSPAIYEDGHLFYVQGDVLFARAFDVASLAFQGPPRIVARGPREMGSHPFNAAVSASGVLAYDIDVTAWSRERRLVWVDRDGNQLETLGPVDDYMELALSPDGERVAVGISTGSSGDIWQMDLRGVRTRLASSPINEWGAVWSPSGDELLFASDRSAGKRDMYVAKLDASSRLLFATDNHLWPTDWDGSGKIWFSKGEVGGREHDLWTWSGGEAKPFLVTPYSERHPRVSPDGGWLPFVSDESGRDEVYLQPLSPAGERRRVSENGGHSPRWRGYSRELFFVDASDNLVSVAVSDDGHAPPHVLFAMGFGDFDDPYDVTADGQRFLVNVAPERSPGFEYTIHLDWRQAAEPQ